MKWLLSTVVLAITVAVVYFFTIGGTGYVAGEFTEHVKGNEGAKVTIVEYSDFQCPYCGAAFPTVKRVLEEYSDDVKFVYKHFPIPSHTYAQKAAEASECAADQGKFYEYHDKLFENQNALYVPKLKEYAKNIGLNTTSFDACLDSGVMSSRVSFNRQEGQTAGVSGTPTFFINGKKLAGNKPFSSFKTMIESELAK